MSLALAGIGVSRGIAIGKVHVLERGEPEVVEYHVPARQIDAEISRFRHALEVARNQLRDIRTRIPTSTPADINAFIDTYLLMLEDSTLTHVPEDMIRSRSCNAEWALKLQLDRLVRVFDDMDDPYLRTRRDDIAHVVNRVLRILLRQDNHDDEPGVSLRNRIVIADDLTPADTVLLQHQGIAAFVTEYGGPLSHTAIMARSLRIPAVVGVHRARLYLRDREQIIVDGREGAVLVDPDDSILKHFRRRQRSERDYFAGLRKLKHETAVTLDQQRILLQANIELPDDIKPAREVGADGVGLYRTEFLFMNRSTVPDEEEQLESYLSVVKALKGQPVTIRTLDLGADKQSDDGRTGPLPTNPALGLRAIRLCLKDPALFRPQLRAILRASAYGPVRLMIPMLSNTQELFQLQHLLEDTRRELKRQGLKFDPNMPIGGMVEVPAAAISASLFARHLDFLSIGTNDLIQYTLAIDRIDDEVNYLYDPMHPSVLRLIHLTIKAGLRASIPVSMCGEMAGDCRYTRLLLGLGLREFSMHPSTLLEVKSIIKHATVADLVRPVRRILHSTHSDQTQRLLRRLNES